MRPPSRHRARLYGRAIPYKNQETRFGVLPRSVQTLNHGAMSLTDEALGVDWQPLVLTGQWKLNFFMTGDARLDVYPPVDVDTPQKACDFFEKFAARQNPVLVTWTAGVSRVCSWQEFTYTEGIGPDRKWTMRFAVLGDAASLYDVPRVEPMLTAATSIAAVRGAHLALDRYLADMPDGFAPSFLDRLRGVTDSRARTALVVQTITLRARAVRTGLARMRTALYAAGDLARAPADALRDLNNLAASTRDLLLETGDVFEDTANEYQLQSSRSEDLLRATRWRGDVRGAVDTSLDAILAILDQIDARMSSVDRYVSVLPGESLVRVAQRAYGNGADWRKIADANGITGQTVPSGITQLVIPPARSS